MLTLDFETYGMKIPKAISGQGDRTTENQSNGYDHLPQKSN